MEGQERLGVSRAVNAWTQTLAILGAGAWGFYVFVYQEFTRPAEAVNLSVDMTLRAADVIEAENCSENCRLRAIELYVTARNPSDRTIYLLDNYWTATGVSIASRPSSLDWVSLTNARLQQRESAHVGEYYGHSRRTLVASGALLPDLELKPDEVVSHRYVFYVPEGAFDQVDVDAAVPSVARAGAAAFVWTVLADGAVEGQAFRVDRRGERTPMEVDAAGAYADRRSHLQETQAHSQLPLSTEGAQQRAPRREVTSP